MKLTMYQERRSHSLQKKIHSNAAQMLFVKLLLTNHGYFFLYPIHITCTQEIQSIQAITDVFSMPRPHTPYISYPCTTLSLSLKQHKMPAYFRDTASDLDLLPPLFAYHYHISHHITF